MSFAQKSRQLLGECRSKYYPALFPDERERPLSQPPLLLEEYINQYHPAPGTLLLNDPSSSEQRRRSLEIALSEINGLMAGMHYQDQVEDNSAPIPTRLPSPTAYPTELSDDLLQETPAEFATSEEAATTTGDTTTDDSDQPLAPQWAAIRSLRQVSEIQHKQFQALAEQLDDPIVSKLLDTYPTARDIRNQGAQLVKDVLDGFRPHELSHIFAFTSFSYSVSILLHSKRLLANADILADIRTWRGLIADTKEKQSFDRIAAGLWPEARAHLDPVEASVPSFRDSILSPEHPSLTGSTNFPASRLPFPQTTTTTAGSLPSLDLYDLGIDRGPIDLMNTVHDAFHLSSFDFLGNDFNYQLPANTAWSQRSSPDVPFQVGLGAPQRSPTPFGSPTQARKQPPQPTSEFTEHPKLEQTVMFLVIFAFFQEVGQLLHILSGRSLASRRYKLYPAQKGGQKAFYRHSQDAFFKPCSERLTPGPPAFQALLSVAESFTKQGYLRSIDDIEHYLAGLAAATLPPGAMFRKFVSMVFSSAFPMAPAPFTAATANRPTRKRRRLEEDDDPSSENTTVPKRQKRDRVCNFEGCNATYSDLSGLRKHRIQVHEKTVTHRCERCGYETSRRDHLRSHFLKQHSDVELPAALQKRGRF